jgi:ribosome-associated protein
MSQYQQDYSEAQDTDDSELSKSELKRRMLALQAMGEQLVALSEQQLKQIPMPEQLADSVYRARDITKRGGRRRELQYIGKIMRSIDVTPIKMALDKLESQGIANKQQFHQLETWRERILNTKEGVTEFIAEYPDANIQLLRQLARNYASAKNEAQKTKAYRALFKLVRETLED